MKGLKSRGLAALSFSLGALVLGSAGPVACSSAPKPASQAESYRNAYQGFPVLQGATDATTTQLGIVVPKGTKHEFTLREILKNGQSGQPIHPASEKEARRESSEWAVRKLRFQSLKPGAAYRFEIRDATGKLKDWRELRTLPATGNTVKFAVTSCADDTYLEEQKKIWAELLSLEPQMLLMIGDNVYADKELEYEDPATPETIWRRYTETWRTLEVFRARRLVPIIGIWDDHDFGRNDGDGGSIYKREAAEIFEAFFAQERIEGVVERGPGVATYFKGFGQRFFFLDDRTFRWPNDRRESGEQQTHWGSAQEDWLYRNLEKSRTPAWLINGNQYFGAYHPFESYEGNHPRSFERMISRVRSAGAPVVFVSGDLHLTELMRIESEQLGYETYELTTSAVHAKTFPGRWSEIRNPRQMERDTESMNYMLIRSTAEKNGLDLDVTAYGPGKTRLYSRKLKIRKRGR